ncbi:hypothetical protein N7488_012307 [Penicillium malachiteum]|nr:hypothetical protein N7488_012307 [Penicillium malachiteum]
MGRRFQWAELQIQALEYCRTEGEIKDALSKVPQTLEDTYQAVLEKINSRDVEWARKILITFCLSPLLFDVETVVSMAGLSFPDDLVRICTTSLINVFDEKVQWSHFSVQEFQVILNDGVKHHECRFSAVNGHKYLREKTVDILLEQTEVLHQETAKDKISFLYAAKHWYFHMTAAGGFDELEFELQASISQLFTESNVYWNWVRAADSGGQNSKNDWSKLLEQCQPPIYRACMLGLLQPVNCLRAQGANPLGMIQTPSGVSAFSPLAIALENGHLHILEDFLEKGLPLGQYEAIMTLLFIDHAKLGEARVASIFKRLWDLDLLRKSPSGTSNEIHEQAFLSAAMNPKSGCELTKMILDWQPKITVSISDELLMYMTAKKHDVLGLPLDRCDFEISSSFLEDLESNASSYNDFPAEIAILATKRPNEVPLTDELCKILARGLGLEEMRFFHIFCIIFQSAF